MLSGLLAVVLLHRLDRWRKARAFRKFLENASNRDPRSCEDAKYGIIVADSNTLSITRPKGDSTELRWSEIDEVHAYKVDLFSVDLICLAFKKLGRAEYCEINEQMSGYHDLINSLGEYLPKFDLTWFPEVAFPAFKTNHKVIWRREQVRT